MTVVDDRLSSTGTVNVNLFSGHQEGVKICSSNPKGFPVVGSMQEWLNNSTIAAWINGLYYVVSTEKLATKLRFFLLRHIL